MAERVFTVILTSEVDGSGYAVTVPILPGCITQGETIADALANAREAIALYLEVLEEHGTEIPQEPMTAAVLEQALATARRITREVAEAEGKTGDLPEPEIAAVVVASEQAAA